MFKAIENITSVAKVITLSTASSLRLNPIDLSYTDVVLDAKVYHKLPAQFIPSGT